MPLPIVAVKGSHGDQQASIKKCVLHHFLPGWVVSDALHKFTPLIEYWSSYSTDIYKLHRGLANQSVPVRDVIPSRFTVLFTPADQRDEIWVSWSKSLDIRPQCIGAMPQLLAISTSLVLIVRTLNLRAYQSGPNNPALPSVSTQNHGLQTTSGPVASSNAPCPRWKVANQDSGSTTGCGHSESSYTTARLIPVATFNPSDTFKWRRLLVSNVWSSSFLGWHLVSSQARKPERHSGMLMFCLAYGRQANEKAHYSRIISDIREAAS
ncbi:hypothetical protein PCH_Pc03g00140 [Penicillium rubens Wisconsin 54-1255]|uniref:Uncharacterized protein n=1 Tax=Penicillium rubens (strain ATCC 28089 / DSM 1075 / NRRL 1951 / Wisconsin 54-1255) TaxID=500485 RepID=B6GVR3_PENRW|nr:hypothetical protein PCH_Pc03g00140 [Penicillium rubens Wisconsin 54-1255]